MRLLIVEDTRAAGTNMERRLRGFGDVQLASGVREAEALVASGFVPDIVLTDMHLRDGQPWTETIPRLRRLVPHAQIFAMTTQPSAEFRREFVGRFDSMPLVDKLEEGAVEAALATFRQTLRGHYTRTIDSGDTRETRDWQAHHIERYFVGLGVPKEEPAEWLRDWVRCRRTVLMAKTWGTRTLAAGVFLAIVTTFATRWVDYLAALLLGVAP